MVCIKILDLIVVYQFEHFIENHVQLKQDICSYLD